MLLFLTILLERKDARNSGSDEICNTYFVNLHWHIETFVQILSAFVANVIFVLVGNVNPLYREFRWKFKKWRFSLRKLCTYRLMIWRNCLLFCSTFYPILKLTCSWHQKNPKTRIHEFKVLHKGQRAFWNLFLMANIISYLLLFKPCFFHFQGFQRHSASLRIRGFVFFM